MIRHYLSLAWQQLEKYCLQSVVSIVSLAIGFACFALASMWIKYETTYDAFHRDADRLYTILWSGNPLIDDEAIKVDYLEQIPEIEEYTLFNRTSCKPVNQKYYFFEHQLLDEKFLDLFGMELLEGNCGFMHHEGQVAVSDRLARHLWGDESPIGKDLVDEYNKRDSDGKYNDVERSRIVTAVFKSWGSHSNFPMDVLSKIPAEEYEKWGNRGVCVMRYHPTANADTVYSKLWNMMIKGGNYYSELNWHLKVLPITQMRHYTKQYNDTAKFQVNHIYLFSVASMLLIVCGLLNYLTLFVNRLFIRRREMALRRAFGASRWNLTVQFLTEYGLLLVIALVFGLVTMELSMDWFFQMSQLPVNSEYIYQETAIYFAVVLLLSLLVSVPVIMYFQRQSLQIGIVGVNGLMRYHIFRRISTGGQISISIFCIFCVVVMMKQIDTLRHGDIGFERENRGILSYFRYEEEAVKKLSFLNQQPEVDTAIAIVSPIFPYRYSFLFYKIRQKENPQLNEDFGVGEERIDETIAQFYGLTLLQGRWPRPGDFDGQGIVRNGITEYGNVCINESFARRLGWEDPIGKSFMTDRDERFTIVGVYKDILNGSPTEKAVPSIAAYPRMRIDNGCEVHFKFKPGTWPSLRQKIIDYYKEQEGVTVEPRTYDDHYAPMLVSENNLQTLLNVITIVCILIALFGVWSMIMLTCEQRRKEIAVRKVFGATTKDILDMFFLEYMTLQGVAALVAFPIGYACMKPWLEQYVVQTEIPWWIYVGIFMAVALLVALCVGWRVWKTATAHPADEICKG